jgi:hypothetical protein
MDASKEVRALVQDATTAQTQAILGAMRAVAANAGALGEGDRIALESADRCIFGHDGPFSLDKIAPVSPAALASALTGSRLAEDAVKFLTVMAFVDAKLDKAKIARVLDYASALGVRAEYLDDIRLAAQDRLQEALAHMVRANMVSITGRPWGDSDATAWLLPYTGDKADPRMAARFETLGSLDKATFGYAFWIHFKENNYAFPGDPLALNAGFCVPHDSAHVLTNDHTDPRGELLVSTFTASMHPHYPMAGHVLPVIFSWHLNIQINKVAKDAKGAMDPQEFWHAWAAGAAAKVDTFSPDWNFWAHVEKPLTALRAEWSIPPSGVDRAV